MENQRKILLRLAAAQVEFVIVGDLAAAGHGVNHMSTRIEICIPFTEKNFTSLDNALEGLHPVYCMTPQKMGFDLKLLRLDEVKNLYLSTDLGVVDCLGEVLGIGNYDAVKAESLEVRLSAGVCRILSIPALIRSKQAMGRPHDLLTITELKAIQERNA